MHIVIDARFLRRSTGGIGRYTQALIRELAVLNTPHQYTLLISPDDFPDWEILVKQEQLPPAKWQAIVTASRHYSYQEQTEIPRLLHRLKPDLVHFTNFNHPLLWNQPFVVTIHDLTIFRYPVGPRQESALAQLAFRQVIQHGLRRSRRVITVSETSKTDLVNLFHASPEKITVTYEGVDQHYQSVSLPQRGRLQHWITDRYGIHAPYLLFVSQWRPHKGITTLVTAYELFRKRYPRLTPQLVIVGKPHPNYPDILAKITQSPYASDIVRPGFVDEADLPKLYQAAELFLCPSQYEGFGLPPLESMASGTPVLAADTSCLPEILNGAAAYARPNDPNDWAEAIHNLLVDRPLWKKLREAGTKHARQFSWDKMAKETLVIYEAAHTKPLEK